ncbi:SDR family oxidoreductase [Acidiferrimicrobium sp. IK]|uniref:SDR family oxidoreductase n=1 Tax=Acidiferrimicrobium sp. IK TaxID=2871700 RepID=UPI0021CB67D6|nr:SDR family oxidoreductase [Acidiferrimicrobium sp. IK]MCU4182748.1 SDR family oxidoreductase [Acidiferrimicrobium sp. IK]
MRIFVTGASGHIASAVIPELLGHGHQVLGLARSDAAAKAVGALGADVRRGDLDDLEGLRVAAEEADGVIHLAFKHEAMRTGEFMSAVDSDLAATRALGDALVGTDKPFVTTSGTLMLAMAGVSGRPGTEDDQSEGGPRVDAANYTLALARQGVRSSVVRLAPMVHSDLDHHGFTSALIGFARDNKAAAYIADGANRWPAANSYDIGVLYRLAVEKGLAGSTYHGVGDLGIPFKVIAETIAGALGVETKSVALDEAPQYLGFLAGFAHLHNPVTNDKTRQALGWEPTHPGWVEDVQTGHYIG